MVDGFVVLGLRLHPATPDALPSDRSGLLASADGAFVIAEAEIEDVALPLYEGRMTRSIRCGAERLGAWERATGAVASSSGWTRHAPILAFRKRFRQRA